MAPQLAAAETAEEKEIYDLLDAAVDAQFTHAFDSLAGMMHPRSLRLFRDRLSAGYDQLLRYFALDEIAFVSGLSKHPKDVGLTDAEVFMVACGRAAERDAEFVGDAKFLPLNVHGTVFKAKDEANVVYSYTGVIQTDRTHFEYLQPLLMTFRRERGKWMIFSCLLARRIVEDWWRDLSAFKVWDKQPQSEIASPSSNGQPR